MASSGLHTELLLPNDASVLRLARHYVSELAVMAELPQDQAEALVQAAVEACANVIDHAFGPGEIGTFTVIGELNPGELVLSIRDQGLPFQASLSPDQTLRKDSSPARVSASGGLAMIRQAVDKAQWINHGKAGKELRLVKYRPDMDVRQHASEEQFQRFREDEPLALEQEYTIRRLSPEDAPGVSRCIYRTYGYTYIHEDCYHPERLVRLNETGELVSVVAVDAAGDVVGHYALERPGMVAVAERGMAVVAPNHRGRGLMQRMRVCLEEEGRRLGLTGVFSVAVTHHTYSQRVNEEFGSKVCGFVLAGSPESLVFRGMQAESQLQRISWIVYFNYITPPSATVAHVPPHHRAMLERIYAGLKSPVEFADSASGNATIALEEQGETEVSFNQSLGTGVIRVLRVGEDTPAEIRRARADLCNIVGAKAVYLWLPLSQPGTPELCREAEEEGFFFSGLGPNFASDGDVLHLQFLNTKIDTSLLQIASPFGQELLRYIDQDRERVSSLRT